MSSKATPEYFARSGFRCDCLVCLAITGLLAASVTGCGGSDPNAPARAAVSGTVTLDGQPLAAGVIRFIPTKETKGPKTTATIEDGVFTLPAEFGPLAGRNRVEIESLDNGGFAMDDEEALQRLHEQPPAAPIEVVRVPPTSNRRSRLVAEISETDDNKLSFELVSTQRRRRCQWCAGIRNRSRNGYSS